MDSVRDFILEFKKHGWRMKPDPCAAVLSLVEANSPLLPDIAEAALRELDDAPTFLVELLDHLDEEQLGQLAQIALELGGNALSAAQEAVLSTIAYQVPFALGPFLGRLSGVIDPMDNRFDPAWRAADAAEIARLEQRLDPPGDEGALMRLFETQRPEAIEHALASRPAMKQSVVQYWAYFSAYRIHNGRAEPLVSGPCHHLVFDRAEGDGGEVDRMTRLHPTWNLMSDRDFACAIGGTLDESCGLCGSPLHRLLDLSALPDSFAVSGRPPIIASCLSCLYWGQDVLVYHHDDDGFPHSLDGDGTLRNPQFLAEPLAEIVGRASPTPYRWQEQRYGERQNVNRIGGRPTWIQNADFPNCPKCQSTMPFLAQLDSGFATESGEEWLWRNGGASYVFWCDGCRVSASRLQCT